MEKTLQDLKAGDLACIEYSHGIGVVRINRITKTQIITMKGLKYRRHDGGLIGADPYYYEFIQILTAERKDKIRTLRLRMKAKKMIDNIEIPTDGSNLKELIIAIKPFVPEDAK